jgi:Ca-activated chloride channel family protein
MNRYFLLLGSALMVALCISSFYSFQDVKGYYKPQSDSIPSFSARDHKGQQVVSTEGAVSFSSGLDNDYYLVSKNGKTGFLYLETKIARFINEQARRAPLNLSIVIDHSGSMEGNKMIFAKKAAQDILDKLSDDDYVSVVIYDTQVEVLQASVPASERQNIKRKIDGIFSRGGTNLWGGTEKGYEQVKLNYKPSYINRVLLISDGLANEGLTDPAAIKTRVQQYKDREGITLSSFGVGLDYNELLMTDMAETGAGNYYFIDDVAKMSSMFDKELTGMMKVAAQNATLRIKLPAGITLTKVFSLQHEQHGDEVSIQFRDLFSEETKGVLMQFAIADGTSKELRFVSSLQYDDVATGSPRTLSNNNMLKPTEDNDQYLVFFNRKVIEQTVLFTANENMEKAMLEADRGNYNDARQLIRRNALFLQENDAYKSSSIELQQMDSANGLYSKSLERAEAMGMDSVKHMQKMNRSESYKIRTKKQ